MKRRTFLKGSLALGTGSIMLQGCDSLKTNKDSASQDDTQTKSVTKPKVKLPKSANTKLNVALIGAGGTIIRAAYSTCLKENMICMADVDDERGAMGFEKFPKAKKYRDFREMLDKHYKELDAVIISTPDHTHFPATYATMERGIAVQTQKPLTHNIWQARTLQKAAHKFKVQTVMGNQGHTYEGIRLIREWYESGLVGEVREVHAWTNRTTINNSNAKRTPEFKAIPGTLDWDLWIGPTTVRNFSPEICPSKWRWWWDFGLGGLGDIGCHTLDIPKYAMSLDYPSVVYTKNDLHFDNNLTDNHGAKVVPKADAATYVFEFPARGTKPPVTVFWYEGGNLPRLPESVKKLPKIQAGGCLLVGDKNTIVSPGMRPSSPRLLNDWMELRKQLPPKTIPRSLGDPIKELFAAVRGDIDRCGSNFDYAVPLTEVVILGTIANRTGKRVEYNPQSMTFKDSSMNEFIKEPVRRGWEYGEDLLSI
ncbi:MAG: Gfo/Idh/MocA family oxidoreductase [Verrucomicrobiota bacterium]